MPSVYFLLPFPSTLQNGVRNKYYCTTVLLLRTSTLPCTYVRDFTVIFLTQDHVPNGWGVSTPTPFIYPRHPWDAITNIIMATRITLFIGQVVYWGGAQSTEYLYAVYGTHPNVRNPGWRLPSIYCIQSSNTSTNTTTRSCDVRHPLESLQAKMNRSAGAPPTSQGGSTA